MQIRGKMARSSLSQRVRHAAGSAAALALLMVTGSCIITTDPEFKDAPRGTPFLLADRVTPDPRSIIVLDTSVQTLTFDAFVQSEDAGQSVEVRLLLDYGDENSSGVPYRDSVEGTTVLPATFADGPRPVTVSFDRTQFNMTAGCHRFTLMVGHDFNSSGNGCPAPIKVSDDSSTGGAGTSADGTFVAGFDAITWTVIACDSNGCPDIDGDQPELSCPPIEASCPSVPVAESL